MFTKQVILIASVFALRASANCIHGTSLHRRVELPGGRVQVSNFGYTGLQGPLNWAGLSAENAACAQDDNQSPINIDNTIQLAREAPVMKIPNVRNAEFENLGSTVEVIVNGTTQFAGQQFNLQQFHFHTPSEHRIAEEYFPLEMHMVHEAARANGSAAAANNIVVIAIIFQLSNNNQTTELLNGVFQNLARIATPGTVTETGALDFTALINHVQTTPLYQYTGSLTTPPCASGLTFLVTQQPMPLNVDTYNAVKSVVKFNSRVTQNTLGQGNLLRVGSPEVRCALGNVTQPSGSASPNATAPHETSTSSAAARGTSTSSRAAARGTSTSSRAAARGTSTSSRAAARGTTTSSAAGAHETSTSSAAAAHEMPTSTSTAAARQTKAAGRQRGPAMNNRHPAVNRPQAGDDDVESRCMFGACYTIKD